MIGLPTIVTSALSAAGQAASGSANVLGGYETSRRLQGDAQDFAARSHTLKVKDLKRAGLNPVLSATGGAPMPGVSSPGGTSPNVNNSALAAAQIKKLITASNKDKAETAVTTELAKEKEMINRIRDANPELWGSQAVGPTSQIGKTVHDLSNTTTMGLRDAGNYIQDKYNSAKTAIMGSGPRKADVTVRKKIPTK